jgi:hypothetical protein
MVAIASTLFVSSSIATYKRAVLWKQNNFGDYLLAA